MDNPPLGDSSLEKLEGIKVRICSYFTDQCGLRNNKCRYLLSTSEYCGEDGQLPMKTERDSKYTEKMRIWGQSCPSLYHLGFFFFLSTPAELLLLCSATLQAPAAEFTGMLHHSFLKFCFPDSVSYHSSMCIPLSQRKLGAGSVSPSLSSSSSPHCYLLPSPLWLLLSCLPRSVPRAGLSWYGVKQKVQGLKASWD